MPQAGMSISATASVCSPSTRGEKAAMLVEKNESLSSGGDSQDGRIPSGDRSYKKLAPPDSREDSVSAPEERGKLLKLACGTSQCVPMPSEPQSSRTLSTLKRDILALAYARGGLRFGSFTLRSGRQSPFFFDSGYFSDGEAMELLAKAYASKIVQSGIPFDVLFGPAYKGIPLVACTAMVLRTEYSRLAPFMYDRKEVKDHGEGGRLVGLKGLSRFKKPSESSLDARGKGSLTTTIMGEASSSSDTMNASSSGSSNDRPTAIASGTANDVDYIGNQRDRREDDSGRDGDRGSSSQSASCDSNSSMKINATSSSNGEIEGSSDNSHTQPMRLLLIDDVLTAGTAIRSTLALLRAEISDFDVTAVCVLLDRQERADAEGTLSAAQKLEVDMKTKVLSVLHMADIQMFLDELTVAAEGEERTRLEEAQHNLRVYRQQYGSSL